MIEQTLDMNQFEISNFKQQGIFAQLLFEDFLMLLLDLLVVAGVLKIPEIIDNAFNGSALFFQFATTLLSLYSALA